ncbi:zinc finger, CCHC-type containing protein [Tanacetum coccineum]
MLKLRGILAVWDPSCFIMIDSLDGDGFLTISGLCDLPTGDKRKRNKSRINGLNINGELEIEGVIINNHIFNFFTNRFKDDVGPSTKIPLTLMVLQEIPLVWVYSALLFNWLDHPPTGSILTWDDLTTCFLAQFFSLESTAKLRNDILMFQQHQGESLYDAWNYFKDLLRKVPHHGLDLWLQVQIFYDYVNHTTQMAIDDAAGGRLRKLRPKESWKTIKDLA